MDAETQILIGICEECSEQAPLFDAILYGRSLQLCDKCTKMTGALVLRRPTNEQVYNSIKPSTRDAMKRASGISPKNAKQEDKKSKPTLEDMRERARKLKEQREKEKREKEEAEKKERNIFKQKETEVLDEKEFLDYIEGQVEEIKKQEEELKKAREEENK